MPYCGYVVRISNVRKHPHADRLVLATVFSENVIVSDEVRDGDVMLYFPSDGQLSEEYCRENDLVRRKDENGEPCGGYLDPVKRNVRIIKLRGEYSDGIVMPLSSLNYTGANPTDFSVGDTITIIRGHEICCKYIPKTKESTVPKEHYKKTRATEKETAPYFVEHVDTPQLRFTMNNFKPGDVISLTEKVHGTSSRNAYALVFSYKKNFFDKLFHRKSKKVIEWKYVVGTRHTTVKEAAGGFYGSNQFRIDWGQKFKGKLQKGECVFGEIAGYINGTSTPIMSIADNKKTKDKKFIKKYGPTTTFTYGCKPGESRFFIYRMTYTAPDGYVIEYPYDLVKLRAKQMGFEVVPELDRFIYTTEEDFLTHVNKWMDIPSTIDSSHVIEGVVVRAINSPALRIAKAKSENFKLIEDIIKADADAPDIEEAEEELVDTEI